jgi:hypothetical protein
LIFISAQILLPSRSKIYLCCWGFANGELEELMPRKGNMFSSSSFGGIVLPIVDVDCMGIILFGYCLGYVHILPNKNTHPSHLPQ